MQEEKVNMTLPKLLYNILVATRLMLFDKNNILNNYLSGSCFPQITLLKPKGKSLPNVCHGNDSNHQATIASRSLSALTESSKESKNICKGASGDKIDTTGKLVISNYVTLRKSIRDREDTRKFIMHNEISRIMLILDKYLDIFYCYINYTRTYSDNTHVQNRVKTYHKDITKTFRCLNIAILF